MSFIEYCAGIGGSTYGLKKAGLKPLFLNEINEERLEVLNANFPDVEISNESFLNLQVSKHDPDLIYAELPTPSTIEETKLYDRFAEEIQKKKSKVFVLVNCHLLLTKNKNLLKVFVEKVEGEYKIRVRELDGINFGMMYPCKRLYIIGIRKDNSKEFVFPKEVLKDHLDYLTSEIIPEVETVRIETDDKPSKEEIRSVFKEQRGHIVSQETYLELMGFDEEFILPTKKIQFQDCNCVRVVREIGLKIVDLIS